MTNEACLRLEWATEGKWTKATLGDYFLGVTPDVGYFWMWEIATAYMERDKTCEIGFADTQLAAQLAVEAALFERLVAYRGPTTDADLARLRRIATAAREVLASGQAQYDRNLERLPDTEDLALEGRYVGDLVPSAKMTALRAAVEGEVAP